MKCSNSEKWSSEKIMEYFKENHILFEKMMKFCGKNGVCDCQVLFQDFIKKSENKKEETCEEKGNV